MIIDFTVSNFRSIHEPVTLSFVEMSPRKLRQKGGQRKRPQKTDEEIGPALDLPGWDLKLLRVAGIFGANASGKSNVVRALGALIELLDWGPGDGARKLVLAPFLLDPAGSVAPTRFDLRVAANGTTGSMAIFSYHLQIGGSEVLEERLTERTRQEERLIFSRRAGAPLECGDALPPALREVSIAAATPFLHVLLRTFDVPSLRGLRDWAQGAICGHEGREMFLAAFARVLLHGNPARLNSRLVDLLRRFDTGIAGIRLQARDGARAPDVLVSHDIAGAHVEWDLAEESAGTRGLFDLGPAVLGTLDGGGLLLLDEFGAHLHPHITRRIVELFQNPTTNPNGAQLLFNSHDNTLMRDALLRRDQIWFTAKRADGSTELYPLVDFKPRSDLAVDTAYLDGRLGAVPFLPLPEATLASEDDGGTAP